MKGQGRIGAEEAARGATAMGAMGKIIHKWKLHWEKHGKISGKNMEQLDIIYRCGTYSWVNYTRLHVVRWFGNMG